MTDPIALAAEIESFPAGESLVRFSVSRAERSMVVAALRCYAARPLELGDTVRLDGAIDAAEARGEITAINVKDCRVQWDEASGGKLSPWIKLARLVRA